MNIADTNHTEHAGLLHAQHRVPRARYAHTLDFFREGFLSFEEGG